MAHEIAPNLYERTRPLFTGRHLVLLIDAVILGNSPARVWVDDPEDPQSAFLWDKAHCYYLAGDASNAEFNSGVAAFIAEQMTRSGSFFKIGYTSDAWEKQVPKVFRGRGGSLVKRDRFLYALEPAGVSRRPASVPAGFRVEPIDASLLARTSLKNRDAVAEEIGGCWTSIERFLAEGFGHAVLCDEAIVCWCTAEYVSDGKCGIGIETIGEYQGRGLATIAASAFVEHAASRRTRLYWDCWKENLPSVAVARKVGFEPVLEYSVYVGRT